MKYLLQIPHMRDADKSARSRNPLNIKQPVAALILSLLALTPLHAQPPNDDIENAIPIACGTSARVQIERIEDSEEPEAYEAINCTEVISYSANNFTTDVWYTFTGTGDDIRVGTEYASGTTIRVFRARAATEPLTQHNAAERLICVGGRGSVGISFMTIVYYDLRSSIPGETYYVLISSAEPASRTGDFQVAVVCSDADEDGIYSLQDTDDDNDGIPDADESVNHALGKPVTLSSALRGDVEAPRATDGNTAGEAANVAHTGISSSMEWLQVDLGSVEDIERIKIWNRTDGFQNRLGNVYVLVSEDEFGTDFDPAAGEAAFRHQLPATEAGNPEITVNARGRYVRLQKSGTNGPGGNAINIAELQVLADKDTDSDGTPDRLDADSDNDGIPDNVEAQTTAGYQRPDGTDTDSDGLDDAYDTDSGGTALTPVDTDQDGTPDYLDTDSDDDGLGDMEEQTTYYRNAAARPADTDSDRVLDTHDTDQDGDGIPNTDEYEQVARGKTATASSQFAGLVASNAVDGDKTTEAATAGDSMTDWLQVDLGSTQDIRRIKIYNNRNCCQSRLGNAYVLASETPFGTNFNPASGTVAFRHQLPPTESGDPEITVNARGRYVRLQKPGGGNNVLDSLLSIVELEVYAERDTDSDGTPNRLEADSDGDGIPDGIEAQSTAGYRPPAGTDTDQDGLDDAYDTDNGGTALPAPVDTDGDGIPDYLDTDSDNDGTPDAMERGSATINTPADLPDSDNDLEQPGGDIDFRDATDTPGTDTDSDDIFDGNDPDADGDGIPNIEEYENSARGRTVTASSLFGELVASSAVDGNRTTEAATAGDSMTDWLQVDLGSAQDIRRIKIWNLAGPNAARLGSVYVLVSESPFSAGFNPAGDAVAFRYQLPAGESGHPEIVVNTRGRYVRLQKPGGGNNVYGNILSIMELEVFRDRDTDSEGTFDHLDTDSDGDGIPDGIEAQSTAGYRPPAGTDTDSDGLDDAYDTDNGGTALPAPVDTDGDGTPDYLDTDSDNDGTPDAMERGSTTITTPANLPDSDNDLEQPGGDVDFRDAVDTPNTDTDGDGILDAYDPDADGDGIPNIEEYENSARGKTATASSLFSGLSASSAVDGNRTTEAATAGNSMTDWLQVDLDSVQDIRRIKIWNLAGPNAARLGSVYVLVSESPFSAGFNPAGDAVAFRYQLPAGESGHPEIVVNTRGRYVRLQKPGGGNNVYGNILSIMELEVLPDRDRDTDNDGMPNPLDTDSDGDGIPDGIEAQSTAGYRPPEGMDTDRDGLDDAYDTDNGGTALTPVDTDRDGTPDFLDTDSDGDGTPDENERGSATIATPADLLDSDNDREQLGGNVDFRDTTDTPNTDTDDDGVFDNNDMDDDNDGLIDTEEYENIAQGKAVTLSSLQGNLFGEKATDGNTNGETANVAHTGSASPNEWLEVDLGSVEDIRRIKIWNRTNCCAERLGGVYVLVSEDQFGTDFNPAGGTVAFRHQLPAGESGHPEIVVNARGRYVRLQKSGMNGPGGNAINIAELQVIADIDTDSDGTPNRLDTDSDGDGIPDGIEAQGTAYRAPTGMDTDRDGLDNAYDTDHGGTALTLADTNGDGTPNHLDTDADGDGIPDGIEAQSTAGYRPPAGTDTDSDGLDDAYDTDNGGTALPVPVDTDGEGTPDYLDTDSDNDGTPDENERGSTAITTPADLPDADSDQRQDSGDVDFRDATDTPNTDTDGDGVFDTNDTDNDNDGIPDTEEYVNSALGKAVTMSSVWEMNVGAKATDGSTAGGTEDVAHTGINGSMEWLEVDLGGVEDIRRIKIWNRTDACCTYRLGSVYVLVSETPFGDSFNPASDAVAFRYQLPAGESGHPEIVVNALGRYVRLQKSGMNGPGGNAINIAELQVLINADTDSDGTPNRLDTDSDGDGIPDGIEAQSTAGYRPPEGMDTDRDGLDDAYDTDNGGTALTPLDTDSDGTPDFLDTDSDGDGTPDAMERGSATIVTPANLPDSDSDHGQPGGDVDYRDATDTPNTDTDGDGIFDAHDMDDDNDGIPDAEDNGGTVLTAVDTDSDGTPNSLDTDSDGDGIPDGIEAQSTAGYRPPEGMDTDRDGLDDAYDTDNGGTALNPLDTDSDGTPDFLDTDSDGDGTPDENERGSANIATPTDLPDSDSDHGQPGGDVDYRDATDTPNTDTDSDGIFDAHDMDDDNDGLVDTEEYQNHARGKTADASSQFAGLAARHAVDGSRYTEAATNGDSMTDWLEVDLGSTHNISRIKIYNNRNCCQSRLGNVYVMVSETPFGTNFDPAGSAVAFRHQLSATESGDPEITVNARGRYVRLQKPGGGNNVYDNLLSIVELEVYAEDPDSDNTDNHRDTDSDGDGIPDGIEAQSTAGYRPPAGTDTDGDGLDDAYDTDNGGTALAPIDTDSDGIPDFLDTDSDNDGTPDASERGTGLVAAPGDLPDTDRDGEADYRDADDGRVSVESVSLAPATLTLTVEETGTLTAIIAPPTAGNQNVTWMSSDESVASVADGVVTAVAAGTATITVATADGGHTATAMVTTVDGGQTATGTTVDGGQTATGTTVDGGQTATGTTVDGGQTAPGTTVDGGQTAPGTTVDGGQTAPGTVTVEEPLSAADPAESTLRVSPVPTSGQLRLRMDNPVTGYLEIRLSTLSGVVVRSLTSAKHSEVWQASLDLSALYAGVYILEVISEKQRWKWRVVKQ